MVANLLPAPMGSGVLDPAMDAWIRGIGDFRALECPVVDAQFAGAGSWRHARDSSPSCVRLLLFQAESGSGLPGGCRWERPAACHADRIGQVAVLPVTRDRAGWNDARDQPADRVDGRPSPEQDRKRV